MIEYKVVSPSGGLEIQLIALGVDGWQLIQILAANGVPLQLIFSRESKEIDNDWVSGS